MSWQTACPALLLIPVFPFGHTCHSQSQGAIPYITRMSQVLKFERFIFLTADILLSGIETIRKVYPRRKYAFQLNQKWNVNAASKMWKRDVGEWCCPRGSDKRGAMETVEAVKPEERHLSEGRTNTVSNEPSLARSVYLTILSIYGLIFRTAGLTALQSEPTSTAMQQWCRPGCVGYSGDKIILCTTLHSSRRIHLNDKEQTGKIIETC
jgi:hypothetical protein